MKYILQFIVSFLSDGTAFVLMLVPIGIFIRLCYLHFRRQQPCYRLTEPLSISHEIGLLGLMIYLILLFTQTFVVNSGANEIKLIPFQIITEQIAAMHDNDGSYFLFLFNILGNIGVFIPIGMFIPALFRKNLWGTALTGFYISLVIETVQLPLERTTDVDDLILNTMGAILGYGIYQIILTIVNAIKKEGSPIR